MSRRQLSITDLARMHSGVDRGLLEGDPGSDESRCPSCGAEVPQQVGELFTCCPVCGHEMEASE